MFVLSQLVRFARNPPGLRSHFHLAQLISLSFDSTTWQTHLIRPGVAALAAILTAGTVEAVMPRPGMSAEEIRLYVDGPIVLAVPIEALETFAATGETTGRLSLLARFVDDSAMGFLQQGLQRQFTTGVVQVDHLTYSPLGRDFLEQLGKVIRIDPQVNGATALRAALINTAAHADESGWTALDVLREFPSQSIDVDVKQLLALRREALAYRDYSQAVVQAIEAESASQAAAELAIKADDLAALADLSQPGPYLFGAETITVSNPALRQTARGLSVNYDFSIDIYVPQGLSEPAPIVIVSHGFGAVKENFVSLAMLRSLTPEQLTAAYGGTPPFPIIPPAISPVATARNEPILDQIRQTGTLRIALRRDAAPLGYINSDDQWTGYCKDLAVALRDEISEQFGFGINVELAELPSTLNDRFELVQNGYVDFECGPNTIREDVDGVVFSNPFLGTGTRLLVQAADQNTINPNLSLEGVRIGLLPNTTTERFFQTTYPKAEFVYFDTPAGSVDAIAALNSRQIDAFANDSVLLVAEALQQNLPLEQYMLVPDLPLTCDFYGLILPNDDSDWRRFINHFLTGDTARQIQNDWFASVASYELNELSYCLNR